MTNEEKAKKIVDSIFSTGFNTYRTFYEMAYNSAMEIAKWKDEKACEWLEEHVRDYKYYDPDFADGNIDVDDLIYGFKKAMEE